LSSRQTPRPPTSSLFPYTTLFRSEAPGMPGFMRLEFHTGAQERIGHRLHAERSQAAACTAAVETEAEAEPEVLRAAARAHGQHRSEEHTSELQSRVDLVCRLLLEK